MKPKQQLDANAAGEEVKKLLAADNTANVTLKDLRTAKAARKEQLKAALTVVWSALESGLTVNAHSTKEEWCAKFAKVTIKTVQRIIFGRKESDRAVALKPGTVVSIQIAEGCKKHKLTLDEEILRELIRYIPEEVEEEKPAHNVKKITSKLTNSQIIHELGSYEAKINCLEDNEAYSKKFEAAVKAHPEWFTPLVERLRKNIKDDHFIMKSTMTREIKSALKTHKMQPGGKRTFCGKWLGDTLAADAKMSDSPTCRNCQTGMEHDAAIKALETHTGQHDDECFDCNNVREAAEQKRSAAHEQFRKRIQTLINTWRNHRLKDEDKYREEFEKAAAVLQKKVGNDEAWRVLHDARGRMEGAIADRNRNYPYLAKKQPEMSEPAKVPAKQARRTATLVMTPEGIADYEAKFGQGSWERDCADDSKATRPRSLQQQEMSEPARALAAIVGESRELSWDERVCNPSEIDDEDEEEAL